MNKSQYSTPSILDIAIREHRTYKAYRTRLQEHALAGNTDGLAAGLTHTAQQIARTQIAAHRALNTRFTWWQEIALQILDDIDAGISLPKAEKPKRSTKATKATKAEVA